MKRARMFLAMLLVASCMMLPSWAAYAASVSATVEAASTGWVSVSAPALFSDAEIVTLTSADGGHVTSAVVDEGTLTFYAQSAGSYTVERTGDDVWSLVDELSDTSLLGHITANERKCLRPLANNSNGSSTGGLRTWSNFNPYRSCSDEGLAEWGTADEPITVLTHFASVGSASSGSLEMTQTVANALLGYAYSAAESTTDELGDADFSPSYLLVEDRDENTGRLVASCLFTPDSDSQAVLDGQGGNQAFNLVVNPAEELLSSRLAAHSDYESDATLAASAASQIVDAEELDDVVVIANLDTMCAYSTGEKIYVLDIATLSDGEIEAGAEVTLTYLIGSGDENAYDGDLSSYESKVEATNETYAVDDDGYVTISLYGGGVYALGDAETLSSLAIVPQAASTTANDTAGTADATDATDDAASTSGLSADDTTLSTSLSASASSALSVSGTSLSAAASVSSATAAASADEASSVSADTSFADEFAAGEESDKSEATSIGSADEEESAAAAGGLFRNEDGSLAVGRIVAVAVAACAVVGFAGCFFYRRRKKALKKEVSEDEGQETSMAAGRERTAPDTPAEAAASAAAAAKAASAAAADPVQATQATRGFSSRDASAASASRVSASARAPHRPADSSAETIERRIMRKARISRSDTAQPLADDAIAGNVLNCLANANS